MQTTFFKWLESHRLPGELDAQLAKRVGVQRSMILFWKRGACPTLQTFKDVYWALGLPPKDFWAQVELVLGPMLKEPRPPEFKNLPDDHICNEIRRAAGRGNLEEVLESIGVTKAVWRAWCRDPDLDLGWRRTKGILSVLDNLRSSK